MARQPVVCNKRDLTFVARSSTPGGACQNLALIEASLVLVTPAYASRSSSGVLSL